MAWQQERYNLISQIKWMGGRIASQVDNRENIDEEVSELVRKIEQWNERDVRVNMDEYCYEMQYCNPETNLIYKKLIDKLELKNGHSILEVGVGMGDLSLGFMRNFDYCAIDSSLFAVFIARENAKKFGIPQERIVYAPNGNYSFDRRFDSTFCVSVLHEADNHKDILSRAVSHLEDKGRIVSIERITNILETPEHYEALLNGEKEIPSILQNLGLNVTIENFFASYAGFDINQKYRFCLITGEKT